MAASVEEEEVANEEEDFRSLVLGEEDAAPPSVDFRTTLVMLERNVLSSVASSLFKSCFSRDVRLASLRYRAL